VRFFYDTPSHMNTVLQRRSGGVW